MKNIVLLLSCLLLVASFMTGCSSMGSGKGVYANSNYNVPVKKPVNPKDVTVKLSLKTQNVYVMENDKLLMATAVCSGKKGYETPVGNHRVISKKKDRRSGTYGFYVNDATGQIKPAHVKNKPGPGWHYVGSPLPYWVEFYPGYGFHVEGVWPYPKTHGCVHVHENVAADFYDLVEVGTPVIVAYEFPEDKIYNVSRPQDYRTPDPDSRLVIKEDFYMEYIPFADSKKKGQ